MCAVGVELPDDYANVISEVAHLIGRASPAQVVSLLAAENGIRRRINKSLVSWNYYIRVGDGSGGARSD